MAAFGVLFAACNKEEEPAGTNSNQSSTTGSKHIAKITVVSDDYRPESKMSAKFIWDADKLSYVYINQEGDLWLDASLTYNETTLQGISAINYERGHSATYTPVYNNGKLENLISNNRDYVSIQYSGNNPTRISDGGDPLSMVWSDGNLCAIRTMDGNVSFEDFDSQINPLNEVITAIFPNASKSMHNPVRATWGEEMTSIRYEYNDGYPSTGVFNTDEGPMKIYFEYTDGSGSRAPVLDKYTPKRAKNIGFELLPDFMER